MDKIVEFVNKKVLKKKEPKNIDNVNYITTIVWGGKIIRMERNDLRKRNQT